MVEFGNRLVGRGFDVVFVVPDGEVLGCSWMECRVPVVPLSQGVGEVWDVVVFNQETQWVELDRFVGARRRVWYALHWGPAYGKEGSWDAARVGVDCQFANSGWTADRVFGEVGVRPVVQVGGVNREVFRPWGGVKRFPVLCSGVGKEWKGTATIVEACERLGVPLEGYVGWDLSQPDLGRAYAAAEVFVVGSWFEGFCQPGLEALACGVPLVTTDNGGCLEYAVDGVTALVVPPRDVGAMAAAIDRLRGDRVLAAELVANGLDLVAESFDWEVRTDEFAGRLEGVVSGELWAPPPVRVVAPVDPVLSVVTLAWDNLNYTQKFAESVRRFTDVSYELIVVDNGSEAEAARYAAGVADRVVLNDTNLGFSVGMNQGLELAGGEWVAFCNNDTVLPVGWASMLLETAGRFPSAGIVVPALTAARNAVTVRSVPGVDVVVLPPFSAPPAAVVYLMRRDVVEALGGWPTEYVVASGEDVDLAFSVWVNDLDIVFDSRVLVDHIGKGTASRLENWQKLWADNRNHFLVKWMGDGEVSGDGSGEVFGEVVRLGSCSEERFARNRLTAQAAATWMHNYFTTRDELHALRAKRPVVALRRSPKLRALLRRTEPSARKAWQHVAPRLPRTVRIRVRNAAKRLR